jgi:hypothetical protein
MIYDTLKTYRVSLHPVGTQPNLDISVQVDEQKLPRAQRTVANPIFIDRVIFHLSELCGLSREEAKEIRRELEAGRTKNMQVTCLHTQLVQAGFIPA